MRFQSIISIEFLLVSLRLICIWLRYTLYKCYIIYTTKIHIKNESIFLLFRVGLGICFYFIFSVNLMAVFHFKIWNRTEEMKNEFLMNLLRLRNDWKSFYKPFFCVRLLTSVSLFIFHALSYIFHNHVYSSIVLNSFSFSPKSFCWIFPWIKFREFIVFIYFILHAFYNTSYRRTELNLINLGRERERGRAEGNEMNHFFC